MKRSLFILFLMVFGLITSAQDASIRNKLENALMNVDAQTIENNMRIDNYISKQFLSGNYPEVLRFAHAHIQGRISVINQMYFALSEQERADMTILIDGDLIFHYILSAAVHTHNNEVMGDVYDYLLFIKQLQLRTTKQINDAIKRSRNTQLLAFYKEYENIRKQLSQSNPSPSLQRNELQNRMNSLGRVLAKNSSLFIDKEPVSWKTIQQRLNESEAAIEFVRFNIFEGELITSLRLYAAVIVTSTCKNPELIIMNTEKNLAYRKTDNPGDLYDVDKSEVPISQWIWLNILTYFNQYYITNIFFAPYGILNTIAIESLPYNRESAVSYHYNLTRLTSTRELITNHNIHPQKTAALYGNLSYRLASENAQQTSSTRDAVFPLTWSKQEIESVGHILQDAKYLVKTYSLKQGTESSIKALTGKSPSILHLSTHGFVNRETSSDVMQKSGLILSYGARAWEGKPVESNQEDGLLTAAEISTLDLSGTDIVVLSACNTALGEITSEGVWGLQRAFKQAGVQAIIMTLWQVDDAATAVFMQYFYEELLKRRQTMAKAAAMNEEIAQSIFDYPREAITAAQLRMRQLPKYQSPYYWAAFVAIF